jgi:Myb-like DNA-binding domain
MHKNSKIWLQCRSVKPCKQHILCGQLLIEVSTCCYRGRKFSSEEGEMVVKLQAQFGNKWACIAGFFPGRTDNDVKNFWSMHKKRLARSHQGPLPSIPRSEIGMHWFELVTPPNEGHVFEVIIFCWLMYSLPAICSGFLCQIITFIEDVNNLLMKLRPIC